MSIVLMWVLRKLIENSGIALIHWNQKCFQVALSTEPWRNFCLFIIPAAKFHLSLQHACSFSFNFSSVYIEAFDLAEFLNMIWADCRPFQKFDSLTGKNKKLPSLMRSCNSSFLQLKLDRPFCWIKRQPVLEVHLVGEYLSVFPDL